MEIVTEQKLTNVSGKYFQRGEQSESSEESRDKEMQERFIEATERLLGLKENTKV